ncbi:beta-N-acetylhexosaminidase [Mytilinidion resinicola]|uniref:beta-N-acetylhexosaminidase n=1 Tax=Mytilinidion resinicola TaxID=574789 RepID=A0A6A6Z888_9PEZI|nr:beta-N-acetylhexosaminidase [Mytilinidion resinicola]KAF2816943.1 beta-N-acetylhexosaminidase [Mytilinidion resinicola]
MLLRFSALVSAVSALQFLPPVQWSLNVSTGAFSIATSAKTIYIESKFASHVDTGGLTLIPPSAYEFAETFLEDLEQITGTNWTLQRIGVLPMDGSGIFLGSLGGNTSALKYENGDVTEEGYELEVQDSSVFIRGQGARGMWWGTRTLLQQLLLANGSSIPAGGKITDAPAYSTRGFMLDAGRKWYAPSFLKDLCTYASFFKMSEFHYHASDNYPLNRGHNETWNLVYSQFSLYPENPDLQGIVQRPNETLSRVDFEDFQKHCAQRGVTVIPEIEAPGHCLSITKWKPELALATKDLLNLTHPDSIPTVKSLWAEFLPWFQTKEVHIGADEYDSTLADDYIRFVNEISDFVNSTSGKKIRIWGTNEPSKNLTISKDIIIQHWQYGESDPVELHNDGYQLINSEDWWAYMSLKNDHMPINPAPYPQFYNVSRVLNFANQPDWQWNPALFNYVNKTEQLSSNVSGNKGAIMATWNDNGVDATTQLEAYYAMRKGIPIVGAKAWSGSRGQVVVPDTSDASIEFLSSNAPGQNLDRKLPGEGKASSSLFSWARSTSNNDTITLGRGSKGMNYSLSLSITGPFTLSGPDTTLSLSGNGTLVFTTSDGWDYPLRSTNIADGFDPGMPGRIWTNLTSSTHVPVTVAVPADIVITGDVIGGSRVWVNGTFVGRFEVFVFGGRNTLFSWSQMAFVAPLESVKGGVQSLEVNAFTPGTSPSSPPPPVSNTATRVGYSWIVCATVSIAVVFLEF